MQHSMFNFSPWCKVNPFHLMTSSSSICLSTQRGAMAISIPMVPYASNKKALERKKKEKKTLLLGLPPQKSQVRRVQLLSCSFLTGPATKKSKVVRLQLLPCSPLAGPAATKISSSQIAVATLQLSCWACRPKNLKQSDCSCCPAALLLGLPPQKSQVRRVQLLSCSFLTGPATKKSKIVRLQLLPCSPLAGPTAKKSQVVNQVLM